MASSAPIQILSIESDDHTRLALRTFLAETPGMSLSGEAINATEALSKLKEKHIDVVLLDLAGQNLDHIDLMRQIRAAHPSARVLIFTATETANDIFTALDAGADGYVLKGSVFDRLENAIRSVRLGTVWLDPGIAKQVLEITAAGPNSASPRELPTGLLRIPLNPDEKALLSEVASSNCVDGVCQIDPSFLKKLRRFAPAT